MPKPLPADRARRWLLAGATALFVARPLAASDTAAVGGEGISFVVLWLLLGLGWLLAEFLSGRLRWRAGWPEVALTILLCWHTLSALWAVRHGAPRPALNMLWEWVGMAIGYFLIRQLVETTVEARAIAAVMIALGVALAGQAFYQYLVSQPEARKSYARNPEEALELAGVTAPPGSPERQRFEQRLASTEPSASFALANSLAGYLVPWLIVAVGGAWVTTQATVARNDPGLTPYWLPRWTRRTRAFLLLVAVPLVACLILTKSRSGYLAALVGFVLIGLFTKLSGDGTEQPGLGHRFKLPLLFLAAVAMLVGIAVAAGAVDRQVLTEAPKSLGYRWQYWQASLAMIREHPWLGSGPGNFQDEYTRYKLPTASEVIAEPHNVLLEIWATAGTPAFITFLILLAAVVLACRGHAPTLEITEDKKPSSIRVPKHLLMGGAVGFVVALVLGQIATVSPTLAGTVGSLALATITMGMVFPWVVRGTLTPTVLLASSAALFVNFLAAGALGFPGVAGSLWLLLGLALNLAKSTPWRQLSQRVALGALACGAAVGLACYFTAYRPVVGCWTELQKARYQPEQRGEHLAAGCIADKFSAEAQQNLAEYEFFFWQSQPTPERFARFEEAQQRALTLRPHSYLYWRRAGDNYLRAFERRKQAEYARSAETALSKAAELYPNDATSHGLLALAHDAAGEKEKSREQAREALRLDGVTSHDDQKLRAELRGRIMALAQQAS